MDDLAWTTRPSTDARAALTALRMSGAAPRRTILLSVAIRPLLLSDDQTPWRALVRTAAREGAAAQLIDAIGPAAADLGDDWMQDRLSFVDVSIGSARLQDALRQLGGPVMRRAGGPAVPILVPPWEQHTLAAHLAAYRVAQAGRRAAVLAALTPEQAAATPIIRAAPAILVSCGAAPGRGRLPDYVSRLKASLRRPVPVLVGGPAGVNGGGAMGQNRMSSDPIVALRACGVRFANPAKASEVEGSSGRDGIDGNA